MSPPLPPVHLQLSRNSSPVASQFGRCRLLWLQTWLASLSAKTILWPGSCGGGGAATIVVAVVATTADWPAGQPTAKLRAKRQDEPGRCDNRCKLRLPLIFLAHHQMHECARPARPTGAVASGITSRPGGWLAGWLIVI